MNYLLLARRNLVRNGRRSLVTMLAIVLGMISVGLFAGYTKAMYAGLRNMAIHGEMIGQISINRKGWHIFGKLEPEKYLLDEASLDKIGQIIRTNYSGASVIPRMNIEGLISNGRSSTIFVAWGVAPIDLRQLMGPFGGVFKGLDPNKKIGVSIADGLGEMLNLRIGSDASVLVSTIYGQANASDIEVLDRVNTGNVATNDKIMMMPIAMARSLKDIGGAAEWLTILIDPVRPYDNFDDGIRALFTTETTGEEKIEEIKQNLITKFKDDNMDLEVQTWRDLSVYYNQVKRMYDIIFGLLLSIVVVIVIMSIANAMSMSVVERTREIGTLRAMGLRQAGVVKMFVVEAFLLVMIGTAIGAVGTAVVGALITAADIRYVPPGNSISVPLFIVFDWQRVLISAGILGLLSTIAAIIPARSSARQPIIESLAHA
jgi:putative ABC transport system permease protein